MRLNNNCNLSAIITHKMLYAKNMGREDAIVVFSEVTREKP